MPERITALFERASNRAEIERLREAGESLLILRAASDDLEVTVGSGDASSAAGTFDWVMFADVRAAESFLADFESKDHDLFELDTLEILAAGEAVADRLRFSQVHTDLVPNDVSPPAVFDSFSDYAGGKDKLAETRILIIYSGAGHFLPKDELEANGAYVEEWQACKRRVLSKDEIKTIALVKGGAFDRFVFFSDSEVYDLAELVYPETVNSVLRGAEAVARDPLAWGALRERSVKARLVKKPV